MGVTPKTRMAICANTTPPAPAGLILYPSHWDRKGSSRSPLSRLRSVEDVEKHRHGKAGEQINQRSEKCHPRNQSTDDCQNRIDEIRRQQDRQQKCSDQRQKCCILQGHGRSMVGLGVGSKPAREYPAQAHRIAEDASPPTVQTWASPALPTCCVA